jgi:hypothetical protein
MLQGTAIAVLSLSVFAAMRVHPLLDPGAALGLLVLVTLFSAILAVKQDALGPAAGTLVEVVPERAQDSNEQVLRGWLLDTSAVNTPLSKLILDWSAEREGFQRFSIKARDDLQQWRAWEDGQIARLWLPMSASTRAKSACRANPRVTCACSGAVLSRRRNCSPHGC